MAASRMKDLDLSGGSLYAKAICFTLPLVLSGVLQIIYNSADLVVVGQFAGKAAVASVGATTSLFHLLTNVFIGVSVGVNILAAFCLGAKDEENASKVAHTSVLAGLLLGAVLAVGGWFATPLLLRWMETPEEEGVFAGAALYMRICLCGMPVSLLYNHCAALLKARGETRKPFCYLLVSGALNVVLNVVFVTGFHLDVAGVALATVVAQALAAALTVNELAHERSPLRLRFSALRISWDKFGKILALGIPAGVQSAMFSVSNVFFQNAVNTFGVDAISGCSAAGTLSGVSSAAVSSFQDTSVTFVSHCMGARDYRRIPRVLGVTTVLAVATGLLVGGGLMIFCDSLLALFIPGETVAIAVGRERALASLPLYFIAGAMFTTGSAVRGLGVSTPPALVALALVCGVRIAWLFTVFRSYHSVFGLFFSYPVTWLLATVGYLVLFARYYRPLKDGAGVEVSGA